MYTLVCNITIGSHRFNQVNLVKITRSWRNLNDTATIKLPRVSQQFTKEFKVGDPVNIRLGYKGVEERVEFRGFVSKIRSTIPFQIECEDNTWILRQASVSFSKPKTTLKEVLEDLVRQVNLHNPHQPVELDSIKDKIILEPYRIQRMSGAEAIQKLTQEFGLVAFFRGNKLYVGFAYPSNDGSPEDTTVSYHLDKNVINHNLVYRKAEDVRVKIRATSILKNNKSFTEELGDENGDIRSFHYYNQSPDDLKKKAGEELQRLKFDGFEGNVNTFFIPVVEPNWTAKIEDPDDPKQKNGSYVVDSVTTTFGVNGARRKVELGIKVTE